PGSSAACVSSLTSGFASRIGLAARSLQAILDQGAGVVSRAEHRCVTNSRCRRDRLPLPALDEAPPAGIDARRVPAGRLSETRDGTATPVMRYGARYGALAASQAIQTRRAVRW